MVFICVGLSLAEGYDDDFRKDMFRIINHEVFNHVNLQEDHKNDLEHNHELNILDTEKFELAKHVVK
jgi:hypothetical protein